MTTVTIGDSKLIMKAVSPRWKAVFLGLIEVAVATRIESGNTKNNNDSSSISYKNGKWLLRLIAAVVAIGMESSMLKLIAVATATRECENYDNGILALKG